MSTTEMTLPGVGQQAEPRSFGPMTRTDIVRYAGASGDFNPLHHDDGVAQAAGFPNVFSIGMLQAGFLATFATHWLGAQTLRRFRVRFLEMVWPGDVCTCSGEVSAVEEQDDGHLVKVELISTRQTGDVVVKGSAEFFLGQN